MRVALGSDHAGFPLKENDANVLAMGARVIASEYARDIVSVWLATPFEGGRHVPRLEEIAVIEREEMHDA
jgi:ribose 5-phosphate isomerase RpiB